MKTAITLCLVLTSSLAACGRDTTKGNDANHPALAWSDYLAAAPGGQRAASREESHAALASLPCDAAQPYYWTSTTAGAITTDAWVVDCVTGQEFTHNKGEEFPGVYVAQ